MDLNNSRGSVFQDIIRTSVTESTMMEVLSSVTHGLLISSETPPLISNPYISHNKTTEEK